MQIALIAVGERLGAWVDEGFREYARRMPRECTLRLVEIPAARRTKSSNRSQIRRREGERILAAVPKGARIFALDERGSHWTSPMLSQRLSTWLGDGREVALLVGGPDGLDEQCLEVAEGLWSLSHLTLPHALVRIVVAEQLYRAWSILKGHPYHRG